MWIKGSSKSLIYVYLIGGLFVAYFLWLVKSWDYTLTIGGLYLFLTLRSVMIVFNYFKFEAQQLLVYNPLKIWRTKRFVPYQSIIKVEANYTGGSKSTPTFHFFTENEFKKWSVRCQNFSQKDYDLFTQALEERQVKVIRVTSTKQAYELLAKRLGKFWWLKPWGW